MKIKTNNIDSVLLKLIQDNRAKIKSMSPVDPVITKDDEWRDETVWDGLSEKLSYCD